MRSSIKKKIKPKSDKILQQTKQNKQTTIFSAKNKLSISEPNFTS